MIKKYNNFINESAKDISAEKKMKRAFMQIQLNFGFFAELMFNLAIVESSPKMGVKTMATDGVNIAYNPEFVNKLTDNGTIFIIIHEIMHNANLHFARQAFREHKLWNKACDYAINLLIADLAKESGKFEKPTENGEFIGLLDERFRNMNAEQIYDLLEKEKLENKDKGKGQPSKGQGKGQPGDGNEGDEDEGDEDEGDGSVGDFGEDIREPGSLTGKGETIYEGSDIIKEATTKKELADIWDRIKIEASTKNMGSGSASFDRWVRNINKPKINWRNELKKFITNVFNELDFGFYNKRFIGGGQYLPAAKDIDTSSYQNVVIAIDTSGSISDDTLAKFATEMMSLFKKYLILKVIVIWCDANIPKNGVQQFDMADKTFDLKKLKPVGGGGTSFKPPFEWIKKNLLAKRIEPAFVIYFTDAAGEAPGINEFDIRKYSNRVLWVITDTESAPHIKFGKKIYIDKIVK
jgi:predicted metal-dependent peptidase